MKDLAFVFENGLQILALVYEESIHNDAWKKWYEWVECSHDRIKASPRYIRIFNLTLIEFFNDVSEQIIRIQGQEAVLLKAGILNKEDSQALSSMLSICDLSRREYYSDLSDTECANHLKRNSGILRGLIDYAPSLRFINDKIVEPTLYKMSLEIEQKSAELHTDSDDNNNGHQSALPKSDS